MTDAVIKFFRTGQFLKEINASVITLIPKCQNPIKVSEFRPISCCNVIYKCISKILADRLKRCLSRIISYNQSAFVVGKEIIDNILLAQEIVKDCSKEKDKPRCAIKIDIMKAFNSISWEFVVNVLKTMEFPLS